MNCRYSVGAPLVALFLSAALAVGCGKNDTPAPHRDNTPPPGTEKITPKDTDRVSLDPVGASRDPAEEDPRVAAYFKKKGWRLVRDIRSTDGKVAVYLIIEDRNKTPGNATLSPDDCRMIIRSKTTQVLDLSRAQPDDKALKTVAGMAHLEGIEVGGDKVTDDGIKALARCRSLKAISISSEKVTDNGIKALAALPRLEFLQMLFVPLTGAAFEAFAGSKTLRSVTIELDDAFTDDGARNLAKLPNLNAVKISGAQGPSKLTAAGIKAIVDTRMPASFEFDKRLIDDALLESLVAKGWLYGPTPPGSKPLTKKPATAAQVTEIALGSSKVTDKGMRTVLNCTNTKHVFLDKTGITDKTLKALSAFKKLSYAELSETKVTAAGLQALVGLPLEHIALDGCTLSEETFKVLGKMTTLKELWMSDAKLKPAWLRHLTGLKKLKDLSLRNTAFDDVSADACSKMSGLEKLSLNNTQLGNAGFEKLLKLPKLQELWVAGTKVSRAVYQKAKKEHPKLFLYGYNK